jgi:hypothetical protein
MSDIKDWKWYGLAGHFICGRWCRFHLCTTVGNYLISTVGQYVHPMNSKGGEQAEAAWLLENPDVQEIGLGRTYETMVFPFTGKVCKLEGCMCGQPEASDWCEIDGGGTNSVADATEKHYELCKKYAAVMPAKSEKGAAK